MPDDELEEDSSSSGRTSPELSLRDRILQKSVNKTRTDVGTKPKERKPSVRKPRAKKNKPVIDFILKQDDSDIKYFVGKSVQGNKAEDRFEEDDWIYGATSLHLAARFFHDVMFKLIEVNKELVNNQENDLKLSPLHITAIVEFHIGTR